MNLSVESGLPGGRELERTSLALPSVGQRLRTARSPGGFRLAARMVMLFGVALLAACSNAQDDPDASMPPPDQTIDSSAVSAPPGDGSPESPGLPGEGTIEDEVRSATSVLEGYYAAIDEGALDRAYLLWADSGRASGQTLEEFRAGYAETADVELRSGQGSLEGAAGSRYAEIPVRIDAVTADGTAQRFEGSYVLRRSVVDGATEEQRTWRIYSAEIREVT